MYFGVLEDHHYAFKGFAKDGTLIGCLLFVTAWSVSEKGDVVLFTLSLVLFTFALSSHCSLGYSAGVGGVERLLRHPLEDKFLQDQQRFSPFDQRNK